MSSSWAAVTGLAFKAVFSATEILDVAYTGMGN
jgi:hypothetical protein